MLAGIFILEEWGYKTYATLLFNNLLTIYNVETRGKIIK